jgi:hypothetical protein
MTTQDDVLRKPLHPNAQGLVKKYVNEFAVSLLLQSKVISFRRKNDEVLSNDVEEAFDSITKENTRDLWKDIATVVGGALFGAFVPGFIGSLSPVNVSMIVVYVIAGFIGFFLIFFGLIRRK